MTSRDDNLGDVSATFEQVGDAFLKLRLKVLCAFFRLDPAFFQGREDQRRSKNGLFDFCCSKRCIRDRAVLSDARRDMDHPLEERYRSVHNRSFEGHYQDRLLETRLHQEGERAIFGGGSCKLDFELTDDTLLSIKRFAFLIASSTLQM